MGRLSDWIARRWGTPSTVVRGRLTVSVISLLVIVSSLVLGLSTATVHFELFFYVMVVGPIVLMAIEVAREIGIKRRAVAAGFLLCLRCRYALAGLAPQTDRCPECGEPFSLEGTVRTWRRWAKALRFAPGGTAR